jgi:hypothetical protein
MAGLVVSGMVLALAACGPDGPGGTPSVSQACTSYAHAVCAKFDSCTDHFMLRATFGTMANCETRERDACVAQAGLPGSGITAAALSSCTTTLEGSSCGIFMGSGSPCPLPAGTLADGAACVSEVQCQHGSCVRSSPGGCGTCRPVAAEGASCATMECADGLECPRSTGSPVCVRPVALGGMCNDGHPCAGDASCVMGTCQANVTMAGGTCDRTGRTHPDCSSLRGLLCDDRASTCVAFQVAAMGQPCGLVGTSLVGCEASGICRGATLTMPGTCAPPVADGQPCDSTMTDIATCQPLSICVVSGDGGSRGVCTPASQLTCG